jgi:DNA polymerase I
VFRPVKYVMRHLTKKKLYRVSLTNRLALTVTEDHSLIGLRPGRGKVGRGKSLRFVEVKPLELKRGAKELIALSRVPLEKVAIRGYPKELYEFLGSFVVSGKFQWADGCVGSKLDGYAIPAGPDAKALLSMVGKLKGGGWVEDYSLRGSPGEVSVRGGKLSVLLIELAEASGKAQVPYFIFNESEENVASFLRGAFGLEGSLSLREGGRMASLSNPRACIPDGIRELLWRLGLPSSTFYTVSVNKDGTSGSPLFWLELDDAQAVFTKVGFLSPMARRRLQKASLRGARAESEGDFVRVGVMDVTQVKGEDYVYDLEVESSHRFFANGILCHNTDSVFLRAPSSEQLDLILAWARKELGIDLEVDKVYRYAAFSNRKKNYAAVYPDGTLEVKGLTGKKSNIPLFIKKSFKDVLKVLSEVKNPDEFTAARENIRAMLRETYLRLKRREIPMEDLAFHVMMSKSMDRYTENTPQHVKAAQLLAGRGREMKPGDVISFVKTTNGVGVKPVELAKPEDIDVDKYVEYMRGTFDQLLDSLGYDFDEILGATKLEDFFGF